MSIIKTWSFLVAFGLSVSVPAFAQGTPDELTPAPEEVCSDLNGAAFGLCNAYCEAQDCDVHSRRSCRRLRRNYLRVTGTPIFPCDGEIACGVVAISNDKPVCGGECPQGSSCVGDDKKCSCEKIDKK